MTTELPVLKATKAILQGGSYGIDIHNYFIRPDDLKGSFTSTPNFVTVGLSEDVPKVIGYSNLSGQRQQAYQIAIRFYLVEGDHHETGSPEFLGIEECARTITSEVSRLLFDDSTLTGTAFETGDITAGVAYLYLHERSYTGLMIEMPVIQEI